MESKGRVVAKKRGGVNRRFVLGIKHPVLWSPGHPHLYDLKVALRRNGRILDGVISYFGMRKISLLKDKKGIPRLMLNNRFLFQFGLLDQGWWPDGLYTAPSDEALKKKIKKTLDYGYNLIRKHVKVEPARWYYHCDRLGVLVWQDMPSGEQYAPWGEGNEIKRTAQSAYQFQQEFKSIIDFLVNHPSIVMWVPFNEGWGQFQTLKTINWIAHYDPTRLVDGPSGWSDFYGAGHVLDIHKYPGPAFPASKKDNRALVLGEFGGLGFPVTGHTWQDKANWGYRNYQSLDTYKKAYFNLIKQLIPMIGKGLSAAVYTQTTDVESEVNGHITYDRKVLKISPDIIKLLLQKLYQVKIGQE